MLSARENYLQLLRYGVSERLVNQYEPFGLIPFPYRVKDNGSPGTEFLDTWGVTMSWPAGEVGCTPIINNKTKVCPDITQWERYIKAPDLKLPNSEWVPYQQMAASVDRKEQFLTCSAGIGLFERLHHLMGFEDTLVNFLLEPEDMHELLDYITQWRIEYFRELINHMHPEYILSHDDWGTKDRLFMSPEIWREFFKERYQKIYRSIREQGVRIIHHADSFLMPIANDLADLEIDVWQGVLPQNDISALQKSLAGKVVLMGGIDVSVIDTEHWTRELVAREVEHVCREYVPGGWFIPCMTYGGIGSVFPGVYEAVSAEIKRQSSSNESIEWSCEDGNSEKETSPVPFG